MKCPIDDCTKTNDTELHFDCFRLFEYRVFPKLWKPLVETFYCPSHGNFMHIDNTWWWYSYFRPLLPLCREAVYMCPNKCHGSGWEHKEVHKGKDGLYYCAHCNWKGKMPPDTQYGTAICSKCKKLVTWRARRGVKLKDLKCPECGGDLEAHRIDKHGLGQEYAGWAVLK